MSSVKIEIKDESWKRMGITRKRGGGGLHRDKREKRARTRGDNLRRVLKEHSDG